MQGASPDLSDRSGWAPLHWAALYRKSECVPVLIRHGVALDAVDNMGRTALSHASGAGCMPIVKLIVRAGANIEIASNSGETAIDFARGLQKTDVVSYLIAEIKWRKVKSWAMVCSSIRDEESPTPMIKALQCDDLAREIASYL
jgi:ankyrin repeat protein